MSSAVRTDRIGVEMQREISDISHNMKDPRIRGMISVTRVDVTRDLRHAKVFISIFSREEDAVKRSFDAIRSAAGYIRRETGARMMIRYTPELHFVLDDSIAYGVEMIHKIDSIVSAEEHSDEQ